MTTQVFSCKNIDLSVNEIPESKYTLATGLLIAGLGILGCTTSNLPTLGDTIVIQGGNFQPIGGNGTRAIAMF